MNTEIIDTKAPFAPTKHLCFEVAPSICSNVSHVMSKLPGVRSLRTSQTNDWVTVELSPTITSNAAIRSFLSSALRAIQAALAATRSSELSQRLTSEIQATQLDVDDYRKCAANLPEYIRHSIKSWLECTQEDLARSCYLLMADGGHLSWAAAKENAALILEQIDDPQWLSTGGSSVSSPDWSPLPAGGVALNKGAAMTCSHTGRPIYPYVEKAQHSDQYVGKEFGFERLGSKTCLMDADGALLATIHTHLGTDDESLMSRIIQCLNYCKDMDDQALTEANTPIRPLLR